MYNSALRGSLFCIIGVAIGVMYKIELFNVCFLPKRCKRYFKTNDSSGIHPKHEMDNFLPPTIFLHPTFPS